MYKTERDIIMITDILIVVNQTEKTLFLVNLYTADKRLFFINHYLNSWYDISIE